MNTDELFEAAQRIMLQHSLKTQEYVELKARYEALAAKVQFHTAEMFRRRVQNMNRPSLTLGAALERRTDADGNITGYVAYYGGAAAEGDTPEIAFQNFDRLWAGADDEA